MILKSEMVRSALIEGVGVGVGCADALALDCGVSVDVGAQAHTPTMITSDIINAKILFNIIFLSVAKRAQRGLPHAQITQIDIAVIIQYFFINFNTFIKKQQEKHPPAVNYKHIY